MNYISNTKINSKSNKKFELNPINRTQKLLIWLLYFLGLSYYYDSNDIIKHDTLEEKNPYGKPPTLSLSPSQIGLGLNRTKQALNNYNDLVTLRRLRHPYTAALSFPTCGTSFESDNRRWKSLHFHAT